MKLLHYACEYFTTADRSKSRYIKETVAAVVSSASWSNLYFKNTIRRNGNGHKSCCTVFPEANMFRIF
jgi:hypothetical protein